MPLEAPPLTTKEIAAVIALINILLWVSMTKMNNKGKSRSPCHNPLELSKKLEGEPLTQIRNFTIEMKD